MGYVFVRMGERRVTVSVAPKKESVITERHAVIL